MSEAAYSPLLRLVGDRVWEVAEAFEVYVPETEQKVTVSKGFRTDLASVPRLLWPLIPPYGRYAEAAIVHDVLYVAGGNEARRCHADWTFYYLMKRMGVRPWRRVTMFLAVRLFGWRAFRYMRV